MTNPEALPNTDAAPPAAAGRPESNPAPSADPEQDFLKAQELFFAWTDVIYPLVKERLDAIQPQLQELQVDYDREDPPLWHLSVSAKGIDFGQWRMDFHFRPTATGPQPGDEAWRNKVEALILNAVAPLRALLPALGVNEYLFDGLNQEVDGLSLPIEPYEDSDLFVQLRYVFPAGSRAALAANEE